MELRGWECADVILFSADAYVDHPAFGASVIGRLLEAEGLRVCIVPQPDWHGDFRDFKKLGRPRLFFGISPGCMDSMVNKYTAARRLRSEDAYSPDGRHDLRPEYPTIVYTDILRKLYPDVPIVLGGIEASLRRVMHYDYWQERFRPSILCDCDADLITYGMGEKPTLELVRFLVEAINDAHPLLHYDENGEPCITRQLLREVATEKNVPFIDLTTATRDLYLQYGEQQCTELLFCQGDNTHTATLGANLIARLGAQLLQNAGILAEHISIPTSITATPAALNLGELYTGVQVSKELLLTGFGLSPETGNVSVTATTNLMISTDNETFASTAQASYAGSTLFQRIYIHALYSEEGEQHDTLVITSGNTLIEVPVTASVLSLDGGSPVSVSWALDAKPVADPVIEGPVSATLTLSNMIAADTKNYFTDGSTMVRFHNAVDGAKASWPAGEIDENATRYIDFAITAPTTMELRITGISMLLASHSTSTMCCHINTGFGEEFTDVQTIYERKNFTNKTPVAVILTPVLSVPAGQTLHVRILPWHEDAAEKSGKYICVKNLLIEGQCFSETGLNNTQQDFTSRKILLNGQLLILLPDGTRFDATGKKVE